MPKMRPMELVLTLEHSCNYLNSVVVNTFSFFKSMKQTRQIHDQIISGEGILAGIHLLYSSNILGSDVSGGKY